jgi:hypothetical protein
MCPSRAVGDGNRGPTLWVGRCGGVRTGVDETLRFSGSAVVRLGRTTGAYPVPAMVSILRGGGNGASLATALYGSGLARVVPVMFCAGFAGPHWGLRRGGGFVGCAHSCDFMPPAGGCCQSLVLAVDPCITARLAVALSAGPPNEPWLGRVPGLRRVRPPWGKPRALARAGSDAAVIHRPRHSRDINPLTRKYCLTRSPVPS